MNSRNEHVIEGLHLLIEEMERKMGGRDQANAFYVAALEERTKEIRELKKELRVANDTLLEKEAEQYKEYLEDTTQRKNVPPIYWALLGIRELLYPIKATDAETSLYYLTQRMLRLVPVEAFQEYIENNPHVLPRESCDKGD